MPLIPAAPDTYALFVRPMAEDTHRHEWFVETVVAYDSETGEAYITGGLNTSGKLARLADVVEENFRDAKIWEDMSRDKAQVLEWARRHVKIRYEDAHPVDRDDPRWGEQGLSKS